MALKGSNWPFWSFGMGSTPDVRSKFVSQRLPLNRHLRCSGSLQLLLNAQGHSFRYSLETVEAHVEHFQRGAILEEIHSTKTVVRQRQLAYSG